MIYGCRNEFGMTLNTMKHVYTLNDLPHSERPRERLAHHGSSALSSVELIALILGRGTRGEPVMMIAQKLLSQFGSLKNIAEASVEDLQKINGLGLAKASQIKACFEIANRINAPVEIQTRTIVKSAKDIYVLLKPAIGHFVKEHFIVVSCDTRGGVIAMDTVSIGILNASIVHPREVFEVAIRRHAYSIILAHNHPSGNTEPSDADIAVTNKMYEAGEIFGVKMIDHIIVTQHAFSSLRELKLFPTKVIPML